jgi:succinate dehydrogenase / fumarate reductase membrane anchor subunit
VVTGPQAGSRLTGLRAWSVQRVNALCLLLFVFFVLLFLCFDPIRGYSQWKASLARPEATGALLAFVAALIAHMWVGLRDVLLDYARPAGLRGGLLLVVALGLFGLGAWMLFIVAKLHA